MNYRRKLEFNEPLLWFIVGLIIILAFVAFFASRHTRQQQVENGFRENVFGLTHLLQDEIDHSIHALNYINAFYASSQQVEQDEFSNYTAQLILDSPALVSFGWSPRVPHAERPAFEQSFREQGLADFTIYEITDTGQKIPAKERAEYFPVEMIEPAAANKSLLGFDNASSPERLQTITQATDSGELTISLPLDLMQDVEHEIGLFIVMPIYQHGTSVGTEAERRANLMGVLVELLHVDDLIANAVSHIAAPDIEIYLYDITNPEEADHFLAFYPSASGAQTLPESGHPSAAEVQTGDMIETGQLQAGNRTWLLVARPGPQYASSTNNWLAWVSLLVGLLTAGVLAGYVYMRRSTAEALAHSEAEFRALADHALTGVLRSTLSGNITYANDAIAEILGFDSAESIYGNRLVTFASNREEFKALFKRLLIGGQIQNEEIEIVTTGGEKRWLLFSAALFDGIVSSTIIDITERMQAQEELRRLFSVVSQMADTVVITNIDGVIEYVNPAFERVTGYSQAEAIGQTPRILKSKGHTRKFYQSLWSTILSGEVFRGEIINRKKNGNLYYEAKTITPIRNAEGKLTYFVATGQDITSRKEMEKVLRQKEEEYRLITENTGDVIWLLDLESQNFTYISPAVEKLRGYTPEEAITQPFSNTLTPDSLAKFKGLLPARIKAYTSTQDFVAITYTDELDQVRKDGSIAHTEVSSAFAKNEAGKLQIVGISRDISDRKLAEEKLRIADQAIQSSLNAIAITNLEGNLTSVNPAFLQLWGFNHESEVLNRPIAEFWQSAEKTAEVLALLKTQTGWIGELTAKRADDSLFNAQLAVSLLRDETNEPVGMVGAIADITERKRAIEQLSASEERFRQLADNIKEGFWLYDKIIEKVVYLSPAYAAIWGRPLQQLYDDQNEYLNAIVADDLPILMAAQQKQTAGQPSEAEYRVRQPDGNVRWVWDRSFPIFDESGRLMRIAGVVTDITGEKIAKSELEMLNRDLEQRVEERTAEVRRNEATYRALFENSNDGIFLMSPDGRTIRANQRALDMVGYSWEEFQELEAEQINAVTPPEQTADAFGRFEAALRGEDVTPYERTFIAKNGEQIDTELNLSVIRGNGDTVTLVQSVVRDITERKKAELSLRDSRDKLSAANAALEKASRLKDEFLASMSHELRTPLTGILGLSEVLQLQAYGELNEKQLKAINNIAASGRHLLELINDILDLSKIEAGKLDLQIESCEVANICQASLQLTKGMAHQKQQQIAFSINPASIIVEADARRLKQMLVNLLSNAVKFTPKSGQLGLEVHGDASQQLVYLTVWDKGIGIKPEEMTKLFKPFTQLDSSLARQHSGTGLGLSLVQRMAELHGGSIKVESVPDQGSQFTIILPWSDNQPQPDNSFNGDAAELGADQLRDSLVIEDNVLDAEQASRYLKQLGLTSITQPVLDGALEKVATQRPGVILLDLGLPDGSGLDFLGKLKADERTRDIPVIITSVAERRSDALKLGAAGYLVKPYSQAELQATLSKVAATARQQAPVMVISQPGEVGPCILMADDNEMILETVSDFLLAKGYRVTATRSGFELLERVSDVKPDIILIDIQMPGMDGMEAMRRVRAHSDPTVANTPIIAVTALAMTGDREKCLQAGANEYMSKPIVLTQLDKQIKRFIRES